jgi:hypothetical protein
MHISSHLKVKNGRRAVLAAALATGLAVTGTTTVFAAAGSSRARSPQEGGAAAAASSAEGFGVTSVQPRVCRGGVHKKTAVAIAGTPQIISGSTPVDLLSTPLSVWGPASGADTLVLTLTAETQLRDNSDGALFDWLEGIILVDGVPVTDVGPDQLALTGSSTYSSSGAQACLRIGPGRHRIQVQGAVITNGTSPAESAWIDDIVLRADILQ